MRKNLLLSMFCIFLIPSALANLRYYASSIDQSLWQMNESSPIICKLSHEIPEYGHIYFTSVAHKDFNLTFQLKMLVHSRELTSVSLISRAPLWRPGIKEQKLLELEFRKYQDLFLSNQVPWVMLNELESGMEPTFFYNDWNNPRDKVAVSLSPVNFIESYKKFKNCLTHLLNYSLDDFSFTVFYYRKGSLMTEPSLDMLEKLSNYMLYDNNVESVHIESFTDSYGGISQNRHVAKKRAYNLRKFFLERGISDTRIFVKTNAMKRYAAKNSLPSERAKNRRVVLRIKKKIK